MKKEIIQGTTIHIIDEYLLAKTISKELELTETKKHKTIYTEIVEMKKINTWYEVHIFSIYIKKDTK